MIDTIVISLVVLAAIFGLIRGVVSQLMAIVGLVTAYFVAPIWSRVLGGMVQEQLGSSRFMAEKAALLMIGVAIYIVIRLIGYGIEKLVVDRVKNFKRLNRLGGAALGGLKMLVLVSMFFFFLALIPVSTVKSWAPRMLESRTYRLAADYNPMGKQRFLERMRSLRFMVSNPRTQEKLKQSGEAQKLFEEHRLKGALSDERFVRRIEEGDFEALQKQEDVEKLMNDDQLAEVLEKLSKGSSS